MKASKGHDHEGHDHEDHGHGIKGHDHEGHDQGHGMKGHEDQGQGLMVMIVHCGRSSLMACRTAGDRA